MRRLRRRTSKRSAIQAKITALASFPAPPISNAEIPTAYSFYSCINSQCVYVGCDSDKECELYLNGGNDAGFTGTSGFGTTEHVECVDKTN